MQPLPGGLLLQPRRPLCSHSSPSPSTCTAPSAGICTGRCRTSWRSPTAPGGASLRPHPRCAPQDSPGARCPAIWRNWPRTASSRASGALAASMPTRSQARFLPAPRGVSHQREKGVPPAGTEEQAGKKTGYARAQFAKSGSQLRRAARRARQMGGAAAQLAAMPVLAAAVGPEAGTAWLLRAVARCC